jgi:hypothetical protein
MMSNPETPPTRSEILQVVCLVVPHNPVQLHAREKRIVAYVKEERLVNGKLPPALFPRNLFGRPMNYELQPLGPVC